MSVDWLPYPPRRPRGSRPPGWAPEAEAIIDQIRDEIEALEPGGGGGAALTPDPDNPGLYILSA